MGKDSGIEWCTHTFNIAWGCIEASAGCDNCYARTLAHRYGIGWGKGAERRVFGEKHWREPLKWDATAKKAGERHRVFCSSMTDVFLNDGTITRERAKLWPLIAQTPNLDWLLLTKHPERFRGLESEFVSFVPNLWLGVSVEDEENKWRIDLLRRTSARVKFLSIEPLLGDVGDLNLEGIHWVIVGGESGPKARPMHPDWARSVRDQCVAAKVPFLFKQWGEYAPWSSTSDPTWMLNPERDVDMEPYRMRRVGKKSAGRELDGRLWDEYPS